jgi:hypothetical protein
MLVLNRLHETKTLETLNALPLTIEYGVTWDTKNHDDTIVVDPDQPDLAASTHIAATDVLLVQKLARHLHKNGVLARCGGALWFVGADRTTVALDTDRVAITRLHNELYALLSTYQLIVGQGSGKQMLHTTVASAMQVARAVMGQAVEDPGFEARYWAGDPDDNYARDIAFINERVVHLREKSVFLCVDTSGEYEELKLEEVRNNLRSQVATSIDTWLASTKHRNYARDVFVPTLKPECNNPDEFNWFRGLAIQYKDCRRADPAACRPLLDHIRMLVGYRRDVYDHILDTWARMLQGCEWGRVDWVKSCIAIIFLSKPGAGKGTITRHNRNIIGPAHATQLSNPRHLFGDFNEKTGRDKIWVEMDELLWSGNHAHAARFKNMITEDTQEAEGKFKKERTYQSAHNYIITTNAEQAAQVDVDDRRFLPLNWRQPWALQSCSRRF